MQLQRRLLRFALSTATIVSTLVAPMLNRLTPAVQAQVAPGTQLYFNDFENGTASGWIPNGGSWNICQSPGSSKAYCHASPGDNFSLTGNSSWSDYSVQGYVNLANDNDGISLLGRVQSPSQLYALQLRKDPNTGVKKWWIWKNNGGNWTALASGNYNYAANTYYLMRLDMQGSNLTASISTDFGNTFQTLGGASDSSYATGMIGVESFGSGGDSFDQIKVTAISSGRDKWLWPFASTSIWNMPIGSGAVYTPANIQSVPFVGADQEYFYKLNASDPLRPVYGPGSFGPGRCTGTQSVNISLPVPDNLIVPDATSTPYSTPNNASAFLMPDGQTLEQFEPLARCTAGGSVYGWRNPWGGISIYGDGIKGTHFGSGLSSIGGSIRLGELTNNQPISHALKLDIWGQKYLYYSAAVPGYRWPAYIADANAANQYQGTNPKLVQGALLAIPTGTTAASLNLQTPAGQKLFSALQNYGTYIVDDSGWNAHYFCVEKGVLEEFSATYGYGFETSSGALYNDYMKLLQALQIVDNNGPNNIGGGGTPRVPLAPPIRN